jgi:hypothetical protein
MFSELPSDLNDMNETLGPPPAWLNTFYSNGIDPGAYYGGQFSGFSDRPTEVEVNPVERLKELEYNQEMNKRIPSVANRYTNIEPLSPLFRHHKAKYGFGAWGADKSKWVTLGLVALAAYFIYNNR